MEVKINSGREIKANAVKRREASLAVGESGQVPFEASCVRLPGRKTKHKLGRRLFKLFPSPFRPSCGVSGTSGLALTFKLPAVAAFDVHLKERRRGPRRRAQAVVELQLKV